MTAALYPYANQRLTLDIWQPRARWCGIKHQLSGYALYTKHGALLTGTLQRSNWTLNVQQLLPATGTQVFLTSESLNHPYVLGYQKVQYATENGSAPREHLLVGGHWPLGQQWQLDQFYQFDLERIRLIKCILGLSLCTAVGICILIYQRRF